MLIIHVHVHVRPEYVEAFRKATVQNASKSMKELGVARFDLMQQTDDPTRFVLVEVYRTSEDPARHKETSHYRAWRDAVDGMMAEPRKSMKYTCLFDSSTDGPEQAK
jgi:autoinducer 2-degrading protein